MPKKNQDIDSVLDNNLSKLVASRPNMEQSSPTKQPPEYANLVGGSAIPPPKAATMPLYPIPPDSDDDSEEFDFKKIAASAIAPYPDENKKMPAVESPKKPPPAAAKGAVPVAPGGRGDYEERYQRKMAAAMSASASASAPPTKSPPRKLTPEEKMQQENALHESEEGSSSFLTRPDRMQSIRNSKKGADFYNTGTTTPGVQWNARPEAEVEPMQTARPQETASEKKSHHEDQFSIATYGAIGVGLLVVVVLVVVLAVTLGNKGDDSEPAAPEVVEQVKELTPNELLVWDILPEETRQAVDVGSTPQSQAFGWITGDPSLSDYTQDQLQQRFAMATFYYATDGGSWKSNTWWLSHDAHECTWFAFFESYDTAQYPCGEPVVGTTRQHVEITHLSLPDNGLGGTIPPEISWLSSLETLNLAENKLKGSIPAELSELSQLQAIDFSENDLVGKIPPTLGLLPNLVELILEFNKLTGTVPQQLADAPLEHLRLGRNAFVGNMPPKLCSIKSVSTDCSATFCGCDCDC